MHTSSSHDGFDRPVGPESGNNFIGAEGERSLWAQIVQLRLSTGDTSPRLKIGIQLQSYFLRGQLVGHLLCMDVAVHLHDTRSALECHAVARHVHNLLAGCIAFFR